MDAKSVEEFQEQIGIKFHEPSLLWNAFIHSSYANEHRAQHMKDNERLEFLGDAVLEVISSEFLFKEYPEMPEGDLTKLLPALSVSPRWPCVPET